MKLSVSNIAWGPESDAAMYPVLAEKGYQGLEAAPTRLFPQRPYDHLEQAAAFRARLQADYGLCIPSIQSIWYGRTEELFSGAEARAALLDYTKAAIRFAAALGCGNLVFGSPKNRARNGRGSPDDVLPFFRAVGDCAAQRGTAVSMEANPPIYHTDFINTTAQAFQLAEAVASPGFLVNLDVGTMVSNGEDVDSLAGRTPLIRHVHISEPQLAPIRQRSLHQELACLLREEGYPGFVSIEMANCGELGPVLEAMDYVKELFA